MSNEAKGNDLSNLKQQNKKEHAGRILLPAFTCFALTLLMLFLFSFLIKKKKKKRNCDTVFLLMSLILYSVMEYSYSEPQVLG